jgi:hypothetical protein
MSSDQEITIALQAALEAVLEMPKRGVSSPHVIPTALVMVALPLMEMTASRAAIAQWLLELHESYACEPEDELLRH